MADWKEIGLGETWDYKEAKEGDSVEGVYAGKEENVGENNSTIYRIEDKDGNAKNVWGSTVLNTRMKNVKEGEEIKIVYQGKKPSPTRKGSNYYDFKVFHREPDIEDEALSELRKGI